MENVEALSQNDISHTGSWEKVVTKDSEFVGCETELKNDSAIVYECHIVYEITECYGIGDVPCENGESECGMERVRVL